MNAFEKVVITICVTLVVLIAGLLWWSPLHANHNPPLDGKRTLECTLIGIQENWLDQLLSNGGEPVKHFCVYKCNNDIEYIAELESDIDKMNQQINDLEDPEKLDALLRDRGYGKPGETIDIFEVPEPVTPLEETLLVDRGESLIEYFVKQILGTDSG